MSQEIANLSDRPPRETGASRNLSWLEVWIILVALAAIGAAGAQFARHGTGQGMFLPALAFTICALAAAFDTAIAKIPNPLTYSAILLGLGLNGVAAGASYAGFESVARWLGSAGATGALAGFAACAAIGLMCMFVAGMGGGDMKLLAAMGAILGFSRIGPILTYTLAVAVIYSLVNLAIAGRLNGLLRSVAAQALTMVYLRQPAAVEAPSKTVIPLAIPLLAGLLLWRIAGG
jgi:prepilin peptidase CpaA